MTLPADTWDAGRDAAAAKLRDMAERMRAQARGYAHALAAAAHYDQAADAVAQLRRSPLQHCRCAALWHGEECTCDGETCP